MSLAEGFGVGFRGVAGVVFLRKKREKGGGVGRVGGGDRQRNRQVNAQASSKLPFSDLPLKKCLKILGEACLLTVQVFFLACRLSTFAYSLLRRLLEGVSHCEQESSNCKQKSSNCKEKLPNTTVSNKAPM